MLKNAAWEKITQGYNAGTTEYRTPDQLRCKFDNLKKEVRKFEAIRRRSFYKTGGGEDEAEVKAVVKLLYEKNLAIIALSAKGLEAAPGDSDYSECQKVPTTLDVATCGDSTNQNDVIEISSGDSFVDMDTNMSEMGCEVSTSKENKEVINELSTTTGKGTIVIAFILTYKDCVTCYWFCNK